MRIDGRSVGIGNLIAGGQTLVLEVVVSAGQPTAPTGEYKVVGVVHRLKKSGHAKDSSQTNHHGSYIVDAPLGETAITLVKSNIPVIY